MAAVVVAVVVIKAAVAEAGERWFDVVVERLTLSRMMMKLTTTEWTRISQRLTGCWP